MNTHAKLAQTFFHNWIKKPASTIEIGRSLEFTDEMKKLGCNSIAIPLENFIGHQSDAVEAISFLSGFDKFDDQQAAIFLSHAKQALTKSGVVFLRMQEGAWNLDRFLELLWRHPHFKVAETYKLGHERDYLLRPIDRRPQVCIGMIAKNEERDLPRCLKSLEGVADGLVLMDTGSVDKTKDLARQWADTQTKIHSHFTKHVSSYFEASEKDATGDWKLWNFGKARNSFIEKIETLDFDYILWMDADDELIDPKIKNLIFLDQYVIQGVMIDSGGQKWPHHRLWKTKQGVRFKGWCHEYPNWAGASTVHDDITIHHDCAPGAHENSNDRNLRILQREIEAESSPRVAFYLANTYKDRGSYEEAIPVYQKRMDFGMGYEDEYWFAVLYKARCERAAKKLDDARATLRYAISKRPDWAEFYMELAYIENSAGNYYKAIGHCMLAKDMPIPPTQLWREPDKYTDQPYRTMSWAYEYLGKLPDAAYWAELAKKKIGKEDLPWDARIVDLKKRSLKTPELKVQDTRTPVYWHRPGAIGDVMITLNLIRAYKEKNPNHRVIYRTHPSTMQHLKDLILMAGADEVISTEAQVPNNRIEYNLIGYPILSEGYPEKPMKKHLLEYFAKEVGLEGKDFALKLPHLPQVLKGAKYVTIHTTAGWSPYKNWDSKKWQDLCAILKQYGMTTVQVGGPDDMDAGAEVRMTNLPFMKSLALIGHAQMHLGIDSWSNHATNIEWEGKGKTPAVILWGSTQHSAAGYPHNENVWLGLACQPCFREDPKLSAVPRGVCPNPLGQTFERPIHACMAGMSVERVLQSAVKVWEQVWEKAKD